MEARPKNRGVEAGARGSSGVPLMCMEVVCRDAFLLEGGPIATFCFIDQLPTKTHETNSTWLHRHREDA